MDGGRAEYSRFSSAMDGTAAMTVSRPRQLSSKTVHLLSAGLWTRYIIFTDHPDNHRLWGQNTKDMDGKDAVSRLCPPGYLILCFASCKFVIFNYIYVFIVAIQPEIWSKPRQIIKTFHPGHSSFELLPSSRWYRSFKSRTNNLKGFYPTAITTLNAKNNPSTL